MSYQVLARKWRPRNFRELAGQEHVQQALVNALDNNRLHHAFLFTGTRGVGKTTIARILAKSLNCEQGVSSTPCGECNACQEINEGRFVDLIEVDAASRTKVEDTRDLLENVQYAPTHGRFKVYLIDEVHMLSTHSFNALLKTLEEPPPHVKFLLATTDPQKLPVTILSRCLQFNLKRLPIEQIQQHLTTILDAENIAFDSDAIQLISRAADGSMRDALSLLDQAIAYGGGEVRNQEVRTMLGTIEQNHIIELLEYLVAQDATGIITKSQSLADQALNFVTVLDEIISALHQVALYQVAPQAVDVASINIEAIGQLAQKLSAEDVQLFYQIGLIGRRDLALAPDPRVGLEMVLIRMLAFKPSGAKSNEVTSKRSSTNNTTSPSSSAGVHTKSPVDKPTASSHVPPQQAVPLPRETVEINAADCKWEEIVTQLNIAGLTQQLALNCAIKNQNNNALQLELAQSQQHLLSDSRLISLQTALHKILGEQVKVSIDLVSSTRSTPAELQAQHAAEKQQNAVDEIYSDQTVKTLINTFDAKVNPDSITPVK